MRVCVCVCVCVCECVCVCVCVSECVCVCVCVRYTITVVPWSLLYLRLQAELPVDVIESERLLPLCQDLRQWLVHSQHLLVWIDHLPTAPEGGGVSYHSSTEGDLHTIRGAHNEHFRVLAHAWVCVTLLTAPVPSLTVLL